MNKFEGPTGVFLSATALEPHRIVKITGAASGLNPPTVGYAGAADTVEADKVIGVTTTRATGAGQPVTVEFLHSPGTRVFTATVAIASAGFCFAAADGQVAATGSVKRGVAVDASTAAGNYLAAVPILN